MTFWVGYMVMLVLSLLSTMSHRYMLKLVKANREICEINMINHQVIASHECECRHADRST